MRLFIKKLAGFLSLCIGVFVVWLAIAISRFLASLAWLDDSRDFLLVAALWIIGVLYLILGCVLLFRHANAPNTSS
jgi:hypothetical protein